MRRKLGCALESAGNRVGIGRGREENCLRRAEDSWLAGFLGAETSFPKSSRQARTLWEGVLPMGCSPVETGSLLAPRRVTLQIFIRIRFWPLQCTPPMGFSLLPAIFAA